MSDKFFPATISTLFQMITSEYEKRDSIFGISSELFFIPQSSHPFRMRRYGQLLETPLGVAAGPHTQMAQNIVAAWLCGARYMELKTVQTLDEIEVSKPCIDIEDEGYNCEWSQELTLSQSFHEYCKAWILIHVLRHKFGWRNDHGELGTIFNMSVGYSLEGIMNENVQTFLASMADATPHLRAYVKELAPLYPEVESLNIPSQLSDNLTLSTMHGCPPDEIERIGQYLIERKLHTTIKLNPTLLGPTVLRGILNDTCGFDTTVPDEAFGHDLKYDDGILILNNLLDASQKNDVDFAVKLTNTLESVNQRGIFDSSQAMNYMSGRALHPLSMNLAAKLQQEFHGNLQVSLSGGADTFNIAAVIESNIRPVTVCSDILKPGGYGRLSQYLEDLNAAMTAAQAVTIDEFVRSGGEGDDTQEVGLNKLINYAKHTLESGLYHKNAARWPSIKSDRTLTMFDCIAAPCMERCPTHQHIPGYCTLTAEGKYDEALALIRETNPLPWSTGYACDHKCEDKCTRVNYDHPIRIREIKRFNAEHAQSAATIQAPHHIKKTVAIIGAGPCGLSAAWFLGNGGLDVTVYEEKTKPGGMLTYALPNFRMPPEIFENDMEPLRKLGVQFKLGVHVDKELFSYLIKQYDYVHIAVGARKSKPMGLSPENSGNVMGFLHFLEEVNMGNIKEVPLNTIIIGGGNSAIDAARTAWRIAPEGGSVSLVYRRTEREMPADYEEILELREEKIPVLELLAPVELVYNDGDLFGLKCQQMSLSQKDESGRARPVPVDGAFTTIPANLIIAAIGQDSDLDFLRESPIETTRWGTVIVDSSGRTPASESVYSGGDVVHGPQSIIQAVADGKEAAWAIFQKEGIPLPDLSGSDRVPHAEDIRTMRARRNAGESIPRTSPLERKNFTVVGTGFSETAAKNEAARCLACDVLCEVCVTVCPNRANLSWYSGEVNFTIRDIFLTHGSMSFGEPVKFIISQTPQVLNIGDFCNECGNCTTFCPTSGRPFADKAKFYLDRAAFEKESDTAWHLIREDETHTILHGDSGHIFALSGEAGKEFFQLGVNDVVLHLSRQDLSISHIETGAEDLTIPMEKVASMAVFLESSLNDMLGL